MFILMCFSIEDPLKKTATIGFINNFGQIPTQLFKKPHPSKKVSSGPHSVRSQVDSVTPNISKDKLFFHNLDNLKPSLQPIKGKNQQTCTN